LRSGLAASWEIPDDVSEDFRHQIDSEKRTEAKLKDGRTSIKWVRVRRNNHLWDCEAMQVAVAGMLKVLPDMTGAE
jgi:hypothetical protein